MTREEKVNVLKTLLFRVEIIEIELDSRFTTTKKKMENIEQNIETAIEIYEDILLKDIHNKEYREKLALKKMFYEVEENRKYLRATLKAKLNILKIMVEKTLCDMEKVEEIEVV